VVIIPPYGHMRDYLDSLSLLKNYAIDRIAPGHGYIIDDPFAEVESIIKHRLQREAKVISALKKEGRASIDQILPFVYDDVHSFMHGVAAFSLEAHLIKLEEDGIVARDHNIWFFTKK
jgi:glyoxylase-like metal-dependent hydrolase (beta-lactamase superfamily II)